MLKSAVRTVSEVIERNQRVTTVMRIPVSTVIKEEVYRGRSPKREIRLLPILIPTTSPTYATIALAPMRDRISIQLSSERKSCNFPSSFHV